MVEFVVQGVHGAGDRVSVKTEKFDTKREALAYISRTPHSYIGRNGQVYTIYVKPQRKA